MGVAVLVRAVVGRVLGVLGSLQVCRWVWLLWRGIYLGFGSARSHTRVLCLHLPAPGTHGLCSKLGVVPEVADPQDVPQPCFQTAWTPGALGGDPGRRNTQNLPGSEVQSRAEPISQPFLARTQVSPSPGLNPGKVEQL